jgi:hypothetical protein
LKYQHNNQLNEEKDKVVNFCLKSKLNNFSSKLQKTITTKIKAILKQCQTQIGPKNALNGIYLVKVDKRCASESYSMANWLEQK